ncbi:MAG: helix-turn-helix domain-containing protein [Bacteroidales bacterium]|nr:helix-turn-helix domain-containing protein [Clostridium sp.]MCM1203651.1 helix-turn-helix domain-containing protein [Bacteroidales bacterium]
MDSIIGDKIKSLRKSFHITQEELANSIGISRQTITGYERKISQPDIEILKRLASFFSVSTDYLLGLDELQNENEEFFNKLTYYGRKLNSSNRDIIIGNMSALVREQELHQEKEHRIG